jgi:hypothetical protein
VVDGEFPRKAHPAGELDAIFECGDGSRAQIDVRGVNQGHAGLLFDCIGGSEHKSLGTCVKNREVDQSVLNDLKGGKGSSEGLTFDEVIGHDLDSPAQRPHGIRTGQQLCCRGQPAELIRLEWRGACIAQTQTVKASSGVETVRLLL